MSERFHQLHNLRPAQARLIAAIDGHGQLQLAAAACAMTQPAASRMLSELERQLDTKLFRRGPKGMEATPAGGLLVRHAKRLVHDLQQMAEEFADLRAGLGGSIRVGAVTGPALGQLVPAIQALKADAPAVDISVEVAPSTVLVQALERGDLDFALARLPAWADPRDFLVEPARDEIVELLVRDGHPMLDAGPVPVSRLAHLPWILQDRGAPIRAAIETAFNDEGLSSPQDVITTSSLLVIIALLQRSDAVAPIAKEVGNLLLEEPVAACFRKLELNRPVTVEPYLVLCSRGRTLTRAAGRLLELTRQNIRRMG